MDQKITGETISIQAFRRLPYYLEYLKGLQAKGFDVVSSPTVAAYFHSSEIQVRKDFASVSSAPGKPRHGFDIPDMIRNIETMLGYHNTNDAVLVGAGSLGHALLSYEGFRDYGLHIVAAFDTDPGLINTEVSRVCILPVDKLSDLCRRLQVHIGIITVPAAGAQQVCDQLIAGGIRAVWNFSPVHLSVPEGILVQNENMAASLALLSRHLSEKIDEENLPDET